MRVYVCVCVCVRAREGESERDETRIQVFLFPSKSFKDYLYMRNVQECRSTYFNYDKVEKDENKLKSF